MKVTIDRFEGKYAICEKENREMIDIEKNNLPSNVKEGDVLIIKNNKIIIDTDETKKRKERINNLMSDLFK